MILILSKFNFDECKSQIQLYVTLKLFIADTFMHLYSNNSEFSVI